MSVSSGNFHLEWCFFTAQEIFYYIYKYINCGLISRVSHHTTPSTPFFNISLYRRFLWKMFEKSLNDLVRGIRAHKGQEVRGSVRTVEGSLYKTDNLLPA